MEKISNLALKVMAGILATSLPLGSLAKFEWLLFCATDEFCRDPKPQYDFIWLLIAITLCAGIFWFCLELADRDVKAKTQKVRSYTSDIDKKSTRTGKSDAEADDENNEEIEFVT